ncbi:NAD(P)-dependent oxidoreductase [Actinomadura macrotermitis]|uniref:NAD(P)-binding domain-containing protein n=1 Tax=Actinomadura macrotermitis TaxID=2585200 RepID=A0A7K0C7X5_9ACTN|nr:hypothetical protein [Actinomadura macrotermitis]
MKVVVFGATGGTGHHVVRQALEQGCAVTAVVRDPARLAVRHPGLTVSAAALADPAALRDAVAGHDAAVSALGANTLGQARAGVVSSLIREIVAALDACGVRRLVAVSAAPVGDVPDGESFAGRRLVYPLVSAVFRTVYSDLAAMERRIRDSPLDWTIARPPRLTGGPGRGRYRQETGANVANGRVLARADLAHAALGWLHDPATVRQVVGVAY